MSVTDVVIGIQQCQVAWYSHAGGNTISATIPEAIKYASISFSRQQDQLDAILSNQAKIMAKLGIE